MNDAPTPARPRRRNLSNNQEGTVSVTNSIGKSSDKSEGKPITFSTPAGDVPADPAYVSVGLGLTQNLGNYESLRLDVRVSLPCGTSDSEIKAAAARAGDLATEFIEEERQKALGEEGITS